MYRVVGLGVQGLSSSNCATFPQVGRFYKGLKTSKHQTVPYVNLIEPNCFMDVMNSVRTSLFEEPLHYAESDAFLVGSSCEKCGHDCECTTSRFFSTSLLFPKAWRALSELARISQMESPVD